MRRIISHSTTILAKHQQRRVLPKKGKQALAFSSARRFTKAIDLNKFMPVHRSSWTVRAASASVEKRTGQALTSAKLELDVKSSEISPLPFRIQQTVGNVRKNVSVTSCGMVSIRSPFTIIFQ